MRISFKHKYIFLAYPRTASRSLRELLDPSSDIQSVHISETNEENPYYHHSPACYVDKILKDRNIDPAEFFKFTFIRNPYTRICSLYRHNAQHAKLKDRERLTFPEYLSRIYENYVINEGTHSHPYDMRAPFRFFTHTSEGKPFLDKVYLFEDLPGACNDICTRLGISQTPSLPEVGRHKQPSAESYYDADCYRMVSSIYAEEILEYKYSLFQQTAPPS